MTGEDDSRQAPGQQAREGLDQAEPADPSTWRRVHLEFTRGFTIR